MQFNSYKLRRPFNVTMQLFSSVAVMYVCLMCRVNTCQSNSIFSAFRVACNHIGGTSFTAVAAENVGHFFVTCLKNS
jgi:hypothetical protein